MPKYKVGDKVRVVDDLGALEFYYMEYSDECDVAVPEMRECRGQIVTIKSVHSGGYHVKGNRWNWTDEMFAGLADEDDDQEVEIDENRFINIICDEG